MGSREEHSVQAICLSPQSVTDIALSEIEGILTEPEDLIWAPIKAIPGNIR